MAWEHINFEALTKNKLNTPVHYILVEYFAPRLGIWHKLLEKLNKNIIINSTKHSVLREMERLHV